MVLSNYKLFFMGNFQLQVVNEENPENLSRLVREMIM
jgi:hypothetical protein